MYQHQSHSWQLATHVPCMAFHTYTYPCSQEFAQPCWIGQPCWTYSCSSLDTGPCSTLLDIPLLIPAGYTIAHTGTCSALLDIPLLSLCSALLDRQAQPCSTYLVSPAAGNRPLLIPAGNNFTGACSALLDTGPCSALLEILLLNPTGACSALLDTGPCSALPGLLSPAGHRPLHSPAGHRPLLSPAGYSPAGLLSPDGHRP